jgi:hypothetical protein
LRPDRESRAWLAAIARHYSYSCNTPKTRKYRRKRFWLDQTWGVCYHDNAPENVQFRTENGGSFQFDLLLILFPLQIGPKIFSFQKLIPPASVFRLKRAQKFN